ncbi:MAG: aspartate carbamoyltransferase catalytic subunit, partial [Candidatus Thioglobus sp.]
ITPEPLIPEHQQIDSKYCAHTIDSGLKDADVIICLRVQKERMQDNYKLDEDTYFKKYALTMDRLKLASHNAIVLHPGPINRGFEIDSLVADSDHSMILQQPKNSIPMRMAILHALLT